MNQSPLPQAKDLIKTEQIVKGTINETLSQALSRLSRSHDALFVFDDTNAYKGIINPYYTTFTSRYPGETKLETCLFKPPLLSYNTSIWDIAHLMAESKIYYLPVIERGEFAGIVTINRVLRAMLAHLGRERNDLIPSTKTVITIRDNASIQQAHTLMKDHHVSRLPVVNELGKLVGIVTRFDIREAFATPKEKQTFLSRSGEKESALKQSVSAYYKKMVYTAQKHTTAEEIFRLMVTHNIGSVVVVDASHKPTGIISTHDVLKMISSLRPKNDSDITIHTPEDFIDKTALVAASEELLKKLSRFTHKQGKLEVILECDKNAAGKPRHYAIKLLLHTPNGETFMATDTQFDWTYALQAAGKKLKHQVKD